MRIFFCIAAAALFVAPSISATAGPAAAQTKLVNTYRDWATYQHNGAPAKICFALTRPKTTLAKNVKRDRVLFYVSAWPQDGVRAEISIKMGYAVNKDAPATIKIKGGATFKLLIEGDKAFVGDPRAELKLINAMKRGASMIVEGRSGNGSTTKDTYSLRGVTKAIDSLARSCP